MTIPVVAIRTVMIIVPVVAVMSVMMPSVVPVLAMMPFVTVMFIMTMSPVMPALRIGSRGNDRYRGETHRQGKYRDK